MDFEHSNRQIARAQRIRRLLRSTHKKAAGPQRPPQYHVEARWRAPQLCYFFFLPFAAIASSARRSSSPTDAFFVRA